MSRVIGNVNCPGFSEGQLVSAGVSGGAGERCGSVTGSVVGDHSSDAGDAVGGEPGPGAGPEPDRGVRGLIRQVLGVGEPGEPVDRRMQVDVAGAGAGDLGPVAGSVVVGAAAVGPPAAAVGDPADLLHIQVHHVAAVAGGDPAGLA